MVLVLNFGQLIFVERFVTFCRVVNYGDILKAVFHVLGNQRKAWIAFHLLDTIIVGWTHAEFVIFLGSEHRPIIVTGIQESIFWTHSKIIICLGTE
jgi:hypothetical protein